MANGDSDAVFGGDGSVKWNIDCGKLRNGTNKDEPKGGGKHHQEGVSESKADSDFTIFIMVPTSAAREAQFRAALRAAGSDSGKTPVRIDVPIEDGKYDQIHIRWQSQ